MLPERTVDPLHRKAVFTLQRRTPFLCRRLRRQKAGGRKPHIPGGIQKLHLDNLLIAEILDEIPCTGLHIVAGLRHVLMEQVGRGIGIGEQRLLRALIVKAAGKKVQQQYHKQQKKRHQADSVEEESPGNALFHAAASLLLPHFVRTPTYSRGPIRF